MGFFEGFKLILSFLSQINKFIIAQKKKAIILIKDKALEDGDQRELEKALSENNNPVPDLPTGKYNGMYERASKKKP